MGNAAHSLNDLKTKKLSPTGSVPNRAIIYLTKPSAGRLSWRHVSASHGDGVFNKFQEVEALFSRADEHLKWLKDNVVNPDPNIFARNRGSYTPLNRAIPSRLRFGSS
jgi:hypothetical protein